MRCITGWHRSEAVCFAHHGTNSAVHKGRFMEISYIMFKFRTYHVIHRNCPYRDGTTLEFINIPPQKWSLPLEFINIQPPKRESRSRFRQPKGSPPLDFVNSRRGLPLEFINIHSQKFPFSMRYGRLTKVGYAGWTTAGTAANYQSTLHLCYALILCVFLPFCFVQHFENFRAYLYPQV